MKTDRKQRRSLKVIVAIIVGVSAGVGAGSWAAISVTCAAYKIAVADCDIANWQLLVLEGVIFAGGLVRCKYRQRLHDARNNDIASTAARLQRRADNGQDNAKS
ncbi:MAG TPA: hypothetical protein VGJ42_00330 [Nitrososphaera sp.]